MKKYHVRFPRNSCTIRGFLFDQNITAEIQAENFDSARKIAFEKFGESASIFDGQIATHILKHISPRGVKKIN